MPNAPVSPGQAVQGGQGFGAGRGSAWWFGRRGGGRHFTALSGVGCINPPRRSTAPMHRASARQRAETCRYIRRQTGNFRVVAWRSARVISPMTWAGNLFRSRPANSRSAFVRKQTLIVGGLMVFSAMRFGACTTVPGRAALLSRNHPHQRRRRRSSNTSARHRSSATSGSAATGTSGARCVWVPGRWEALRPGYH